MIDWDVLTFFLLVLRVQDEQSVSPAFVIATPLPEKPLEIPNTGIESSHLLRLLDESVAQSPTPSQLSLTDSDTELDIESIADRCRTATTDLSAWLNHALFAARCPGACVPVRLEYGFALKQEKQNGQGGVVCRGESILRSVIVDFGRRGRPRHISLPSWLTLELKTECESFPLIMWSYFNLLFLVLVIPECNPF